MVKKTPTLLTVLIMALSLLYIAVPTASAKNELQRANARAEERMERTKTRLASPNVAIQNSCESRKEGVVNRMKRLVELSEKMLENFDTHATKVQDFYISVVVPKGVTVKNYDKLVADIAAKKAVVQTTLANAQADVDDFSCTNGDPKTYLNTFRTDMQAVKTALKEYRTTIKNLIVAVRTAAEALETPTPTPTATSTPTLTPTLQ